MKGIVLAGGSGTRLWPITTAVSKQLLSVYDKPMIYYPISTLMLSGVREILVISSFRDLPRFRDLLGDGSQWGIRFNYAIQESPKGIAEALIIGENFISGDSVALALGDNIFHGTGLGSQLEGNRDPKGAVIFGYEVSNPSEYGVATVDVNGRPIKIEEKPVHPKSNLAIPGLYFYDKFVVKVAREIKPSKRNELEISAVNNYYLNSNLLKLSVLSRGTAWFDTGTPDSLHDAASYVKLIEQRQGLKVGCPEEIAWRKNWITDYDLQRLANNSPTNYYSSYLLHLLNI